jgi:ribonuclease-3
MTRLRAYLVCENRLGEVAAKINLGPRLIMSRDQSERGGRQTLSVLSDCLESILAAVFLDGGLNEAMRLVKNLWASYFKDAEILRDEFFDDHKTKLQEYCQKHKLGLPLYREVESRGPAHAKTFTMSASLSSSPDLSFQAQGGSKKEAQQKAADGLLKILRENIKEPA